MARLRRPWVGSFSDERVPFGPTDCLLSEYGDVPQNREERVLLMEGEFRRKARSLFLHPYPKRASAKLPDRDNFPIRPKIGQDLREADEKHGHELLRRMNEVVARTQELEEALDDPENIWLRLRKAWDRAKREEDPRMSEIVRQARDISLVLRDLERRIRRVLRRSRELTPLDRVQEIDRASMVWLHRQPGRTVTEQAGSSQRIMATVRRENLDTLENRVLNSYVRLAEAVAREWLRAHPRAKESGRYQVVDGFRKTCHHFANRLTDFGVSQADAGITPNYVLMQDRGYWRVYEAWLKLLKREKALDEIWAWQAQTWTDFAVLAIVLAIDELEESELIAQSPIIWRDEATTGRWFDQDRPLAVFWLRKTDRVVEIQARPEAPGAHLTAARAHVALKISNPAQQHDIPRRVAVWTPHAMKRLDLTESVAGALALLQQIQSVQNAAFGILRNGLILTPAHGVAERVTQQAGAVRVDGIALDASGKALAQGLAELGAFVQGNIYREAA